MTGVSEAEPALPADVPADSKPRTLLAWVGINVAVFVAYSIAGVVVLLFGIGRAEISPVFPPSGIAVAAMLIYGPRVLPAVFLGQFANGFPLIGEPGTTLSSFVLVNIGTGTGSAVEALIAYAVMRGLAGTWHPFERARHVVVFLLGACLASAVVCGAIGTSSLWIAGFVPTPDFWITFATFFMADAAGIAVFGALLLAWYREPRLGEDVLAGSALILAAVLLVAAVSLWTRYPVDYLFLPVLIWAGFRGGARGVTLAAAAITVVTIFTTIRGVGSFVGITDNESILLLDGFMGVITFTGLLVVAVRSQQLRADAALEAHNRMLERRVAERTAEVAEKNRLLEQKQERIELDLNTARALQAAILPTDFAAYRPSALAAFMRPALEVGGDFYDVFPVDGGKLGLVVADVSGKGVAAAFFMAVTRTTLKDVAPAGSDPASRIAQVNDALCAENPIDMFVTLLYAELDEATGAVRWVNAGHCEPILLRADGTAELIPHSGNLPVGILPGQSFIEGGAALGPGETLFLYTDGVTEATDAGGELFGTDRLLDVARRSAGRSPEELTRAVIEAIEAFSAGAVQADDITCLAIRRTPPA